MPNTIIEHVVKTDGIFRRTILESQLKIEPDLIRNFLPEQSYKIPNLIKNDMGTLSLSISSRDIMLTARINKIPLPVRLLAKAPDLYVPTFAPSDMPIHKLFWEPPEDMNIFYNLWVVPAEGCYNAGESYLLVTASGSRATYRLPLPNIYDDGRLCTGQYRKSHATLLGLLDNALTQFEHAEWNADLLNDFIVERSAELFQFEPIETGFKQKERRKDFDWKLRCRKVGSAIIDSRMVIA